MKGQYCRRHKTGCPYMTLCRGSGTDDDGAGYFCIDDKDGGHPPITAEQLEVELQALPDGGSDFVVDARDTWKFGQTTGPYVIKRPIQEGAGSAAAEITWSEVYRDSPAGPSVVVLPTDSKERKDTPIYSGVLAYFPRALAYVAKVSKAGNDKHNPGEPLHWSKDKSNDHADCCARHLIEQGKTDHETGLKHSGYLAWRALALLETELGNESKREAQR